MAAHDDRNLWEGSRWQKRRLQYKTYRDWYDGKPLQETMKRADPRSGDAVKKFPLNINLPKLGCDIHRDYARGMPDPDAPLIVKTTVERRSSDRAEELEELINDVWRHSYGGPIQQEGMLDMNIYGGCVYYLKWEPWNRHLPYRLAVRKVKYPGNILPTWSQYDPWRMTECYIGYMISRDEARARYKAEVPETVQDVLYLEYWGQDEWWVHVHGQVPTYTWDDRSWQLRGSNPYGFIPVYYIPHERTTKLFGDSSVEGQKDLTREFNSRAANLSDIVRSTRPGMLWGHDISRARLEVKAIKKDGKVVTYYIDVGDTRNIQGAAEPALNAIPVPDMPEGLVEFPDTLLGWWMLISRVSPASFGLDDTQSGRITGPATAQRMWTSLAHSATERMNYTTGKCMIDQDIVAVLKARGDAFSELGIDVPALDEVSPYTLSMKQNWPPTIPLDRQQLHQELVEELKEGGASIERYLRERGVEDIDGEKQRIQDWQEWKAETEAKAQPMQQGGYGAPNQSSNQ